MYLRKVHIENIRSIAKLDWEIPKGKEAGWHVVIGDNGSGKTTFMRAAALALIGDQEAIALREGWREWVRNGEDTGLVEVELISRSGSVESYAIGLSRESKFPWTITNDDWLDVQDDTELDGDFDDSFWDSPIGTVGEFSAAYGPFRRFSGGDQDSQEIFQNNPRLGAHLSIFDEKFALTEALKWLHDLDYRKAKQQPEGELLDRVKAFVSQEGFLPHHAKLTDISPDAVVFTDGDGKQVPIEELSDGYRSILSMTFELIRQMSAVFKPEQIFSTDDSSKIIAPGVVLIDEVDAHLHPTWQRRIGLWFREHFPNIQFIVTTHSPLVCQAADTVFRLPAPGSEEQAGMVTGIALQRLLYGDVLDAYGTALFGEDVGRSERGKEMMKELAELNVKEVNLGLSKTERARQQKLRAAFPSIPYKPLLETTKAATNGRRKENKK